VGKGEIRRALERTRSPSGCWRAIIFVMRRWTPKGDPVSNPKPESRAAEGRYGKRATVDSVAAALASSAWSIADHLVKLYR
jgi:hypothetical protein